MKLNAQRMAIAVIGTTFVYFPKKSPKRFRLVYSGFEPCKSCVYNCNDLHRIYTSELKQTTTQTYPMSRLETGSVVGSSLVNTLYPNLKPFVFSPVY